MYDSYDGLLEGMITRLERTAQAFYWSGYQNGLMHGVLLVLVVWVASWYVRSKL